MDHLEQFRLYLPKYLSPGSSANLFSELRQFPDNMDERLYIAATELFDNILQGDGISSAPVINLPDQTVGEAPVMVISNSCDNDPSNPRLFASRLSYCPIMKLNRYKESLLRAGKDTNAVESHINDIRNQRIAQIFYLPVGPSIDEERFILFNNLNSCDSDCIYADFGSGNRLFRLSNLGFYIFVFKLSLYFTRISEGIDRG